MGEVFLKVLNMSIAASWLILAVMLLRFVLKTAPKWIAVLLWGIVALRLAVPFSFESALSLIPSAETFNAHNIQYETPAISSGIPAVNNTVNPVLGEAFAPNPATSVNPLYGWTLVVSAIWLFGIAAMLLYAVISYVRVHRSVAERMPYEENIFLCDYVNSPFILGLIRPKIYLPSNMDAMTMEPVIAHEKAHLARRDHLWKPMGFMILTVHWFNPMCWIAYVLLCRDIELACDEKVIQQMDLDGRKQYSTALLECSAQRRLVTICPLAFGEVGIKERVKNVLSYKKPAFWIIVVAVIACAVVTVCFATNPERERAFSMPGCNVSDLEPQRIVEEIAGIENLKGGSTLCVNADNFDLWLTSDFDWENDGTIRFFYVKDKQTLCAQLRLFASEKRFRVTEHVSWSDQDRIFSLDSYLSALKYLPKEQIRELSPDADLYQVVFLDAGGPEDYDNVVTYTPEGAERIDGWLIHLGVLPFHRTASDSQSWNAKGSGEIIHLFYGPQGTEQGRKLTFDDVVMLSQKGDALTWSDFEGYQGQDIGSGLYIMRYEIDELFDVLVGGVPNETPMYIRLRNQDINAWVDLREDSVERVKAFIEAYKVVSKENPPEIEELRVKYPEYFELGTFKGLEVYAWQMAESSYRFGLMEGTNREKTLEEKMALKGATAEEMALILSTYDIESKNIFVIQWQHPISSYMVTGDMVKDPEYINNIRSMLGLDGASMSSTEIVNIVDRTKTEGLSYDTAVEKFFEDGDNEYYFSGIYSHYVIVHYEDGSQEDIVTALNAGRAAIADLDKFEVDYIVRALGTEN